MAGIDVYYTQDYTAPDETNVTTAVARDSDTGEADTSGSGQINFRVNLADGYSVVGVEVEGGYKNLKDPTDTGVENVYRVTKVTGSLTITITTSTEEPEQADPYSFTVTDDGITNSLGETMKSLKITEPGTYYLTGVDQTGYAEGRVQIQSEGVTVVLTDVSLTYTNGAVINAKYDASIVVEGYNYLTRVIDLAADPTEDGGKVIKGESDNYYESVSLTFTGSGYLQIDAPKKGIGVDVYVDEGVAFSTESVSVRLDAAVTIDGPTVAIYAAHECVEANVINLVSGVGRFVSSGDDGINVGIDLDDSDEDDIDNDGNTREKLYPNVSYSFTDLSVNIYGGTWYVNSVDDGIDSNGNVYVYGGVTEVYSSTAGDNDPIDYGAENRGTFTYAGGTLLGVGVDGFQRQSAPTANGAGSYVLKNGLSIATGDTVEVTDADGHVLYSFTAPKTANVVLYCGEDVTAGTSSGGSGEPGASGDPRGSRDPRGSGEQTDDSGNTDPTDEPDGSTPTDKPDSTTPPDGGDSGGASNDPSSTAKPSGTTSPTSTSSPGSSGSSSKGGSSSEAAAKTGDDSNITLWLTVLLITAACTVILLRKARKTR